MTKKDFLYHKKTKTASKFLDMLDAYDMMHIVDGTSKGRSSESNKSNLRGPCGERFNSCERSENQLRKPVSDTGG